MAVRLSNESVSVFLRGYALAVLKGEHFLIWCEIAPQHPKSIGAIWASMVTNNKKYLTLADEENGRGSLPVCGLGSRYRRFTMDAPRLAGRARFRLLRLVAPMAVSIQEENKPFVALEWPGISASTALAAMLERNSPYPIQIGWGDYLLGEALARKLATPLITGGIAPSGYLIDPSPWDEIILSGIKRGLITMDGKTEGIPAVVLPPETVTV